MIAQSFSQAPKKLNYSLQYLHITLNVFKITVFSYFAVLEYIHS
jgi:hypothetical protein